MMIFTAVRDVQQWLNRWGSRPRVSEDGVWGPQTEAALSAFARMNALPYTAGVGYQVPTEAPLAGNTVALLDTVYDRLSHPPGTSRADSADSGALSLLAIVVVAGGAYLFLRPKRTNMRGIRRKRRR